MKGLTAALTAGFLFGTGLAVSGMTRADKVIAFLDLADGWDPSLALVMVGAIGVHFVLFRLVLQRPSPVFASQFGVPTRRDIDARLVVGAGLFGIGWGLGGYCPGPGMVSVSSASPHALVFIVTMTAGVLLYQAFDRFLAANRTPAPAQDA